MLSCPLSLNNVYCYAQTHSRSCWCATCWDGLDGLFELFGNRVEMLGLWPSSDKLRFDCARSGNRRICQTSDLSLILYVSDLSPYSSPCPLMYRTCPLIRFPLFVLFFLFFISSAELDQCRIQFAKRARRHRTRSPTFPPRPVRIPILPAETDRIKAKPPRFASGYFGRALPKGLDSPASIVEPAKPGDHDSRRRIA